MSMLPERVGVTAAGGPSLYPVAVDGRLRVISTREAGRVAVLRDILRKEWACELPGGLRPEWSAGLYPSHIQNWLMRAVAADGLQIPGIKGTVDPAVADQIRARFDATGWEIITRLGTIASTLAHDVRAHFDALGPGRRPSVTPQRVSEWATAIVALPYRAGRGLPDPGYLAAAQSTFQQDEEDRASRARVLLSDKEFEYRYTAVYETMWHARGPIPAELSPERLGLGSPERPPMNGSANWRCGTDRSVLSRYGYYRRKTWSRHPERVAEAAGLDPARHLGVRLLTAYADTVARDELRRVCSPIGLRCLDHHSLVSAVAAGVQQADLQGAYDTRGSDGRHSRPGDGLKRWGAAHRELPSAADPELAEAVREYAQHWAVRGRMAQTLANGVASAVLSWTGQVERAVPRRLWDRLHSREVEWEAPLLRSEAAQLVPQMFQHHLVELIKYPISDPDPDLAPPPGPVDPDDPRLTNTLALLLERGQEFVTALVGLINARDERWRDRYLEVITGGEPFTAEHATRFLTPEEFRTFAAAYLGDPDAGGA